LATGWPRLLVSSEWAKGSTDITVQSSTDSAARILGNCSGITHIVQTVEEADQVEFARRAASLQAISMGLLRASREPRPTSFHEDKDRMATTSGETTYDTFLSYSRDDESVATKLQRRLERLGTRRSELPTIRVFRDQTDLKTTEDLHQALAAHIEASRSFIVLCSPSAARSEFVATEIDMWRQAKPGQPIVLALVDGALHWDDTSSRFDLERSTALPPSLADHFTSLPTWIALGGPGRRGPQEVTDDGVHQLASVVLDRDLREVRAEEQRIQRRQLRRTQAVAAIIAALAVAAGLAFLDSRRNADLAAERRDIAQSQALAGTAQALFNEDPDLAMLLAIEADRLVSTPESESSLLDVAFRGGDLGLVTWAADDSGTFFAAAYNAEDEMLFVSVIESTDLLRADLSAEQPGFELVESPGETVPKALGFDQQRGTLYSIDEAGNLATRDGVTGEVIEVDSLGATVLGATVSADGRAFAAVTTVDGQAWEAIAGPAADPTSAERITLPFSPWWIAVSPTGMLATLSGTGAVAVWDPSEGQWVQWVENRIPAIAAFSLDDSQLATGARDGGVRLYDLDAMAQSAVGAPTVPGQSSTVEFAVTQVPPVGHAGEVQALVASDQPDTAAFWSVGSDGKALAWSPDNVVVFGPLGLVHGGSAVYASPLPDGAGLLTMGRDSSIQRYRGPEGSVVYRGAPYVDPSLEDAAFSAESFVTIAPRSGKSTDGTTVAIRGDGEAVRIAVGDGGRPAATPLGLNVGRASDVLAVAESDDQRHLAVGGRAGTEGTVTVWNIERQEVVGRVTRPGWVSGVEFADASTLYVVDQSFRGLTIQRIDADGLTMVEELEPPSGQSPAPFPDGSVGLGIGGENGDQVTVVGYGRASEFMVVQDGKVTEHNLTVPLQQIEKVAVSPTGSLAALALSDGRIFLWDVRRGELISRPLDQTQGRLLAMAFYDDDTLVTGGRAGWVNLWDVRRGRQIGQSMNPHRTDVTGITVSPDTDSIISVAIGNAIRWDLNPTNWATGICRLVGRDLSSTEWERFLPDRPYHRTCSDQD
jgi:WD40 repeat protein